MQRAEEQCRYYLRGEGEVGVRVGGGGGEELEVGVSKGHGDPHVVEDADKQRLAFGAQRCVVGFGGAGELQLCREVGVTAEHGGEGFRGVALRAHFGVIEAGGVGAPCEAFGAAGEGREGFQRVAEEAFAPLVGSAAEHEGSHVVV